jgi:hypothetical protein
MYRRRRPRGLAGGEMEAAGERERWRGVVFDGRGLAGGLSIQGAK